MNGLEKFVLFVWLLFGTTSLWGSTLVISRVSDIEIMGELEPEGYTESGVPYWQIDSPSSGPGQSYQLQLEHSRIVSKEAGFEVPDVVESDSFYSNDPCSPDNPCHEPYLEWYPSYQPGDMVLVELDADGQILENFGNAHIGETEFLNVTSGGLEFKEILEGIEFAELHEMDHPAEVEAKYLFGSTYWMDYIPFKRAVVHDGGHAFYIGSVGTMFLFGNRESLWMGTPEGDWYWFAENNGRWLYDWNRVGWVYLGSFPFSYEGPLGEPREGVAYWIYNWDRKAWERF